MLKWMVRLPKEWVGVRVKSVCYNGAALPSFKGIKNKNKSPRWILWTHWDWMMSHKEGKNNKWRWPLLTSSCPCFSLTFSLHLPESSISLWDFPVHDITVRKPWHFPDISLNFLLHFLTFPLYIPFISFTSSWHRPVQFFLADPGEARGCFSNTIVISKPGQSQGLLYKHC